MLLDIVILPSQSLRENIGRKIRQATRNMPAAYVVDNRNMIYHSSLFHIRISKQRMPRLIEIVKRISKKYGSTLINSKGLELYEKKGIGIKLSNNQQLKKLSQEIIVSCYRLRSGMMPWNPKRAPNKTELRLRKKYGTQHNVEGRLQPHFTIAEFLNGADAQYVWEKLKSLRFSFVGNTVAICEVNRWHQVTRIIKKFKLKG
jgi:hypothetical protein